MTETTLLILVVLVGFGWVVLAVTGVMFFSELKPRLKQLSGLLSKAEALLGIAVAENLPGRAGSVLADMEGVLVEAKARLSEVSQAIARIPGIQDKVSGAAGELNRLFGELNEKGAASEVVALLARISEAVDELKRVLADLDGVIGPAKAAGESVSEGISSTRERIEDAVNILGGVKAGILAGLKALSGRDAPD